MFPSPRKSVGVRARLKPAALLTLIAAALTLIPSPWRAAGVVARAQDGARKPDARPQGEEIIDDDEVLKIDTDLVLVEVNVTDAEGKPVRGLRPEDFKLYMDGDERPVAF